MGARVRKLGCQSLHQQAADQLGGNLLGGAGEEGLGEVLGGRGGYWYGFVWNCRGVLRAVDNLITAHPAQLPQHFSALIPLVP